MGTKYVGEWKDDKFNGQGTYTYANGTKYVGEWKDSKYHGQGTHTFADGRVKEGIWRDDEFVSGSRQEEQQSEDQDNNEKFLGCLGIIGVGFIIFFIIKYWEQVTPVVVWIIKGVVAILIGVVGFLWQLVVWVFGTIFG